jgi:hypothetical protein
MFDRIKAVQLTGRARWPVYALMMALPLCLGELDGERRAGQRHIDYVTAQAARTVAIGKAQTKVVIQTEIKYRDRIQKIYLKGEVIEKQVPIYVTRDDDAVYGVNAGFVRAYNAAWSGDDPGPATESDRGPAGIPLSAVADVDAHNATSCRAWREQAIGFREFYGKMKAATVRALE